MIKQRSFYDTVKDLADTDTLKAQAYHRSI